MNTKLATALEHIVSARRKSSKSACWFEAELAGELAGVDVHADSDTGRWPDLERLEQDVMAALGPDTLIVTRHDGLVEWLGRLGIVGPVVAHVADPDLVRGKRVYGVLPLHLAAQCAEIVTVDLPGLPQGRRATELSADEMDEYGARLVAYQVLRKE